MATENLKVKITADAAQAKAEIGKFKNSLKDTVGAADDAAASAVKLKGALTALAAVKVAKAMIKNAISVAAVGDAIKDNAQKVFMGTTAFQEWGYVLEQNGVNASALKMGMRKFSQEVAAGSDTLAKYGITATDVDTAFSQAVATIQNMSSETDKIAAATELFGTRALELMPVLNLTSAETQTLMASYRALGGTMSNELIAASDVCTDSITAMKAAWGGLRNVLAAYVIPVVTKVVQWITVAIAKVRILLAAIFGLKETFGGGGKKSIAGTTANVAKNTGGTANNLKKAVKHAKELRRTMMGIDELSRLAEKATAAASGGGGGGGSASAPAVSVGDPGTFDGIISDETLKKITDFQEKINTVKDLLNGAYLILKGLVEISFGNFKQGIADITEGISKLIPDSVKEKWEAFKKSVQEKIENVIGVKVPSWDEVKAKWDELKTKFVEGIKTAVTVTFPDWASQVKTKWDEFKKNFAEGVKTAVTVTLPDFASQLKGKWDELKQNFAEAIQGKVSVKIPTWDEVKAGWEAIKKKITEGLSGGVSFTFPKWEDIKGSWEKLKDKFTGKKVKISISIPKWSDLKGKWNKLKKKFKGKTVEIGLKFSAAAADLKAWINNNVLSKVRDVFRKIPVIGPKYADSIRLARGGVLTAPTQALLGEYPGARSNPEIATPQSLMYETMMKANGDLVSAFAQMTRQVITAIEDKDLSVKIGDEAIARSAQRGNAAYRNRTGKPLLSI